MPALSKKTRRWGLVCAFAVTLALIWWARVYGPRTETLEELETEITSLQVEAKKLAAELAQAEKSRGSGADFTRQVALVSRLLPKGSTPEEVNAEIQSALQAHFEKTGAVVRRYTEVAPGKWRDYPVARIEFQLLMNMQQLAELLQFLETFDKAVRVESLRVTYQRTREASLVVSLRLGTLYMEPGRRFQAGSLTIRPQRGHG